MSFHFKPVEGIEFRNKSQMKTLCLTHGHGLKEQREVDWTAFIER